MKKCLLAGVLLATGAACSTGPHLQEYRNAKDGSLLMWIPGDWFDMGDDRGDEDERPAHQVEVEGFWLGKFEVTNAQYAAFVKATGEDEPSSWSDEASKQPDHPVAGLTWKEARQYCEWAGLRLPTEAEWEYAARGGKGFRYPTENGGISHELANYHGTGGRDKWEGTAPVGSFPPNPFGICDMAGNAWEWTDTFHEPYPYVAGDGREDPKGQYSWLRVMRGGCWDFSEVYCTATHRHRFRDHLTYEYVGLRVALTDPPPPEEGGK